MNRLIKYSESINRFIDCKKDYVTRIINIDNAILLNKIKNNDKIFSVIMLTILNNTCRKNKLSVNGYYMTILIEILSIIIFDDVIDVSQFCTKQNLDIIHKFIKNNNKIVIKKILFDVLKQCRIMDGLNVNKKEMHNPVKHIIIKKGNSVRKII